MKTKLLYKFMFYIVNLQKFSIQIVSHLFLTHLIDKFNLIGKWNEYYFTAVFIYYL